MTSRRPFTTALTLLLPLVIFASVLPSSTYAQGGVARPHPNGQHVMTPDGRRLFVLGYNYEGPADRAWHMWERFDSGLIDADLRRARGGGANTIRLFVQNPLPSEIMAGDFSKLDAVVASAARQGLYILLTLYDYGERDLGKVNEVNRRIAAHYRGNPTILAYDLRNEPQFLTLATATYPAGTIAPIQHADLVQTYGERVRLADISAWRSSADAKVLPPNWNDNQAYAYANNLAYFRDFLAAAESWAASGSGRTVIDFPNSPESQPWQPFWSAMDGTLSAWISVQREAIRSADPEHMLTIGWSNSMFARLPANGALLDFVSLHRFPAPGIGSVAQIIQLGNALRRAFPNRPLMLEEIGFSTAEIDPEGAATLEMATLLQAYNNGFAGFLKWMLTDLPPGGNPREDNFGALSVDGNPKPSWHVFGAFGTYLANTVAEPGGASIDTPPSGAPSYRYVASDAFYSAKDAGDGPGIAFRLAGSGQIALRKRGAVLLLTTQPGQVTLNLPDLMPVWNGGSYLVEQRSSDGWVTVANTNNPSVTFATQPATPYRISMPRFTDQAAPRAGCQFFPETGHNLCGGFLNYWQHHGGLAIFGYPLAEECSERSQQDGKVYTVQYFERNRFEYHPENAGTSYDILLGLLGNNLTANRHNEAPFVRVGEAGPERDFFPETGHTLGSAFRSYWERTGGLAVFGYPTSEEFQERNPADGKVYTVQYFERNRFEYHPENAGTPYEVLLGLLGNQIVDGNGWR